MTMMPRKTFDDALHWLSKYYNYNLSHERRERYWDEFKNEDEGLFANVTARDIPDKLRGFPTLQELRTALTEGREKAYFAQKSPEMNERRPIAEILASSPFGGEFAEAYAKLLRSGKAGRREYLAWMEAQHEKYPKAGWLTAAQETRQWFNEHGGYGELPALIEPVEAELVEPDQQNLLE